MVNIERNTSEIIYGTINGQEFKFDKTKKDKLIEFFNTGTSIKISVEDLRKLNEIIT